MASINLSGILELPLGGSTRRRKILFTHTTTTGEVVAGFTSVIEIGESGEYDIDLNYGNVKIKSFDPNNGRWVNHGVKTINSDTPATSLPELIGVSTPVTDEELLIIQGLVADAAQSAADAEAAADALSDIDNFDLYRIARSLNTTDESIIKSTNTTEVLDAKQYIFNVDTQVVYAVPKLITTGSTIVSINGDELTTNNGAYTMGRVGATTSVTLEELGYDGTNAGDLINYAWDNGLEVELLNDEYITNSTAYIVPNCVMRGKGANFRGSRITAANDFDGTVIDTLNFDELNDGDIVEANPDSGTAAPTGVILKDFIIRGSYNGTQTAIAGTGFGCRVYAKSYDILIRVYDTINIGFYSRFSTAGVFDAPYSAIANTKKSELDVLTYNTGKEGIVFFGPSDISPTSMIAALAAGSAYQQDTIEQDSVEFPLNGYGVPNCRILSTVHAKFINTFNNRNGRGLVVERLSSGYPAVRFDFKYVQSDKNWGNIYIGGTTRPYGDKLETHGYEGVDGSRSHLLSETSQYGLQCPNINVHREGDEMNSTAIEFTGVNDNVTGTINKNFGEDEATNVGHGLKLNGICRGQYRFTVNDQGDTGYDGESATGLIIGASVEGTIVDATVRNNAQGVDFYGGTGKVSDNTLNLRLINNDTQINNVARLSRLYRQRCDISTNTSGVLEFSRTEAVSTVEYTGVAGNELVTISHQFYDVPNPQDVKVSFSYDNNGFEPDSVKAYFFSATSTDVVIRYNIAAGGSGRGKFTVTIW